MVSTGLMSERQLLDNATDCDAYAPHIITVYGSAQLAPLVILAVPTAWLTAELEGRHHEASPTWRTH
eukprot:jgi/Ulvmu1/4953/UM206_0005.1